jgi:hypothetical protein
MANRDWSPIATAPHDGTPVEALNDWGKIVLARFSAEYMRWVVELPEGRGRIIMSPGTIKVWRPVGADDAAE